MKEKLDELNERIIFYEGLYKFTVCVKELNIKDSLTDILKELKQEVRILKLKNIEKTKLYYSF